ncbi:AraC family transcriptional regulator [Parashewanella curva]|uniref:AraC family transcriptional regulator n=1 Tax=Parashewanella curva TaxID=2338552 RepID=A0A3L8PSF9_9GAMM|nr:AraC family transcriptional regulator [Parashewanella curva]RLV58331.1 AraC family transcriptional regulator [Parashewanella curva]
MGYSLPTDALALKRVAEHLQLDIPLLEQKSGIDFQLIEKQAWIPATRTRKLYLAIASQLNCSDYPIKIGLSFSPDTLGPLGILFLLSSTLEQGFKALERFYPLQDKSFTPVLKTSGETTAIEIQFAYPMTRYLQDAVAVTAIFRLFSLLRLSLGREYQPLKICFKRGLPFFNNEISTSLNCEFNSKSNAIFIPTRDIQASTQMAGEAINQQIRETIKNHLIADKNFIIPLKQLIKEKLEQTDYSLELAAQGLNLSVRTLQRRLKDLGLTFSKLVQLVRLELALELLENKNLTLAMIAEKLGYADESVLSRALIHKYGITPSKYRSCL